MIVNQDFLRKQLAEECQIEVCEITINRFFKNDVRLTLMYRDLPEIRKAKRKAIKQKQR